MLYIIFLEIFPTRKRKLIRNDVGLTGGSKFRVFFVLSVPAVKVVPFFWFLTCLFCYFRLWMDSIYIGKQVGTLWENIGVVGMSCCDIKCEPNKSNN